MRDGSERKIAAIGVRVRRWVSYHGISINVAPDLSHYRGIVPCGIAEHGVTSLQAEGVAADMAALDAALRETFAEVFDRCRGMRIVRPSRRGLRAAPQDEDIVHGTSA